VVCVVLLQAVKLRAAYAFPFIAIFAIGMLLNVELLWSLKLAVAIAYYFIWHFLNSCVFLYIGCSMLRMFFNFLLL